MVIRSFLLIAITIQFFSCNPSKEESTSYSEEINSSASEALSRDSVRSIYLNRIEARSDPMPTRRIIEKNKLYPVDEAPLDTTFFVFRERLKDAVADKNIFFLMENIDDNIVLDDQRKGLSAFAQKWELTSEAATLQSPLWSLLNEILAGGGVFRDQRSTFIAPYITATFPEQAEPQTGAITGAGVRMRAAPSLNSQIEKVLTHDIVKIMETTTETTTINEETYPWTKVSTMEGIEGFVWGKFVGVPGKKELVFKKGNGSWKIVKLINKNI